MKFYTKFFIIILTALIIFFIIFFNYRLYYKEFFFFDTIVEVKFFCRNFITAKNLIKDIKKEFYLIDSICSPLITTNTKNSILSEIVSIANEISNQTDGAFDISIGVISKIYNRFKTPVLPDTNEIIKKLKYVNFRKINVIDDSVILGEGQIIDIGGIAKGYALKRGIEIMKKRGIKSGMINAGGDISILGNKNGKKWKIGIRDPFSTDIIDTLFLEDVSIATSGDYERYFEIHGKIYHHILDPKTGYPANTFKSVTVIYDDPIYADAYATAIFILGEKGIDIATQKKLKVVIIKKDKEVIKLNI